MIILENIIGFNQRIFPLLQNLLRRILQLRFQRIYLSFKLLVSKFFIFKIEKFDVFEKN